MFCLMKEFPIHRVSEEDVYCNMILCLFRFILGKQSVWPLKWILIKRISAKLLVVVNGVIVILQELIGRENQ